MKIIYRPEIDYLSIDFKEQVEAKSVFQDGIIVRYDKKNQVIGLDITDSMNLFFKGNSSLLSMKEACKFLGVSESTIRRKVKQGILPYSKPNKKDFCFKKEDLVTLK